MENGRLFHRYEFVPNLPIGSYGVAIDLGLSLGRTGCDANSQVAAPTAAPWPLRSNARLTVGRAGPLQGLQTVRRHLSPDRGFVLTAAQGGYRSRRAGR